ncbi:MAG: hypothetical protein CMJ31_13320 [Phycisphaerae bacterium]|nr:hypothetical protein [Phycisphaerae bacterium]
MIQPNVNGARRPNAEEILREVRSDVLRERASAIDANAPGVTRLDGHCHSRASSGPAVAALGLINCPECYSEPEAVYDQAMARGMDLVTITDHDTIAGAMELKERGFQRFIVGQEVSVKFPEDRCMLHVLVWGLDPVLAEEITKNQLRADVYQFAAWLRERNLAHAVAHPLYIQNGKLKRWHIERATLLFKGFECLNGAHNYTVSDAVVRYVNNLTPSSIESLVAEHGIEPLWPRAWEKARTGGSDDHGLLNVGRTFTEVVPDDGKTITDPVEFFRLAMDGKSRSAGIGGHSALLAHQLATVGAHYYADRLFEKRSPSGRYLAGKLLRFAGVRVKTPSKKRVAAYTVARKMWLPKRARTKPLPIVRALRKELKPVLERFPEIRDRLKPETWSDGAAVSQHEAMADFVQELTHALSRSMGPSAVRSLRKRDPNDLTAHLMSYAFLHVAQLPYLFSLFHQNKERNFIERFEHETSAPGSGVSVLERPMRVSLFTDTVADVNGVCRFIQNVAEQAHASGRDLEVITSTRKKLPATLTPNVYNFDPTFATAIPKYDNLDISLPPIMKILRHCNEHQPDVIHISTPGPVGCVGFLAAKMLRIPVLGVYHTDFPAYIDQLFDDDGLHKLSIQFMRAFYKPFSAIFTRSEDYVDSLAKVGLPRDRMVSLMPGFDSSMFHTRHRDLSIWKRLGVDKDRVKILYVGRVSVEKNMPLLTQIWKSARKRLRDAGIRAELVVVGDGPYREEMARELKGKDATFLGFRYGEELSAIYASCDLFCFPSTTDTLGQVVMESQGSGLPVIVSDEGGPKEVVQHGRTGFVIPASDPDAWIEHLVTLATDRERCKTMGAAAHASMQPYSLEHSFEHFWEVHVEAWHEHLSQLGVTRSEGHVAETIRARENVGAASAAPTRASESVSQV